MYTQGVFFPPLWSYSSSVSAKQTCWLGRDSLWTPKMANKKQKSRKNRKNFTAIPFSTFITLSTLAANTVLSADLLGSALAEDLFVISVDGLWTVRGLTAGEVPLGVGLAHGDYSVTEILENLEIEVISPDSMIEMEKAKRKVRRVGTFAEGGVTDMSLNDGKPIRSIMKFTVGNSQNISVWVRNNSGSALTTGATLQLNGTIFGRWLR